MSNVTNVLPVSVRHSMAQFGADIATARRKRRITAAAMAARMGVAKGTYLRIEKGNPGVGLGAYAMALFVLGLGVPLGNLIDVRRDDTGLMLDLTRLPKRVHMKQSNRVDGNTKRRNRYTRR